MNMIDCSISFPSTKHPYPNYGPIKRFSKSFLCSKQKKFANIAKVMNILAAFYKTILSRDHQYLKDSQLKLIASGFYFPLFLSDQFLPKLFQICNQK